MTIEQELMKNLMHFYSSTRRHSHKRYDNHSAGHTDSRHPHRKGGRPHQAGSRGSANILALLSKDEGLSQQQIADSLEIRAQSVSEAVSVLESRGLVRKEASESDRRKSLIFITDEGLSQRDEMKKESVARTEMLFSSLTDEEKEELLRLLRKINADNDEKSVQRKDNE